MSPDKHRAKTGQTNHRQVLRNVPLFAALTEETLRHIVDAGILRSYAEGEHILIQGEHATAAYVIIEGIVRIYRLSREGREQVLVRLEPGRAFNTVPLFHAQGLNEANAVAVTPVILWTLLNRDFIALITTHSDLALAILGDFAHRLDHLTGLVEDLALYTVESRLARFLLDHAPDEQKRPQPPSKVAQPEAGGITQRWTQQEIATHLGTVRDMVGRELRAFQDAGLIRLGRGKIALLDRERLEAIADR
jgi:CRP/FNR family transcriptional regulator